MKICGSATVFKIAVSCMLFEPLVRADLASSVSFIPDLSKLSPEVVRG